MRIGSVGVIFDDATQQPTALTTGAQTIAGAKTFSTKALFPAGAETIVLGAVQNTTSGTVVDFTGIPAGVKRVTLNMSQVSTSGASQPVLRLGTSGGVVSSGYLGATGSVSSSSGIPIYDGWSSAAQATGSITLSLLNSATNLWAVAGGVGRADGTGSVAIGSSIALAGALDRLRITTTGGTDAFDLGSANISWEF